MLEYLRYNMHINTLESARSVHALILGRVQTGLRAFQ